MAEERGAARRLVRRTDDRMIAGVCSGLADHFGTDPLVFRLGFVVLAVLGLTGVLVYVVAWALIPPADPAGRGGVRRSLPLLGLLLFALAAVAAVPALVGLLNVGMPMLPGDHTAFHAQPLAVAMGLVATGIVLLRTRDDAAAAPAPESVAARPARPRRERSGLAAITLAAVLLVLGLAGLGSSAGWVPLDVGQLAALALLLVGGGLVVGAWFGRARLLIVVGTLMIPVVLAASLVDFPASGTIGNHYLRLDRGAIEDMEVLVGQATLDLSDYPFKEGVETVRLRVGAGGMTVIVPHDVRVIADVSVQGGDAYVFGGYEAGFGVDVVDARGPKNGPKVLEVHVDAGLGTVGVYRMNDPKRHRERKDARPNRRGRDGRKP